MQRAGARRAAIIAGVLPVWCVCALALEPSLDISQYAHKAWKVSDGFAKGIFRSIAQTPDGYLWVGTDFGLLRFDGVRAVPWQPPKGERLPHNYVTRLLTARDGRLWIGASLGLASWKDGALTRYPELDGRSVQAILEDRDGAIWVGGWSLSVGRLCRIQSGSTRCYGEDGRFGSAVSALHEDRAGNLWIAGNTGLWRWTPGQPKLYVRADATQPINSITESDDGGILIATTAGITKLKNGKTEPYPLPAGLEFKPGRFFRDRDGGLWIGAVVDMGLLHIHNGRTDLFTPADGLSGGSVSSLFEDREGSIWVTTVDGIDRFRNYAIRTFSVQQGLSSRGVAAVLGGRDGSLWLGTSDGLNRWNKGQITIYRKPGRRSGRGGSPPGGPAVHQDAKATVREITDDALPQNAVSTLFEDERGQIWVGTYNGVAIFKSDRLFRVAEIPSGVIFSISGDRAGNIWISHEQALFHLLQARVVERIPWASLGRGEPATALMHDAAQGVVWLAFDDGVGRFEHGRISAFYAGSAGLAQGPVRGFYLDRNRTLWAACAGGLSRIKDGRVFTVTSRNGLPCDMVHWMIGDDAGSVWLYLSCGLARIARSDLDTWASGSTPTARADLFDSSDGVRSLGFKAGRSPVVTKSADGRLWFLPAGGVSVVDPNHLGFNTLPPPVHIESLTVDDKAYDIKPGLRLHPNVRNLRIEYTALSFVAPEKTRFKYKLEGQNRDWQEVINERYITYTNLPPRNYRFRVVASNNSGVWNETGDTLEFSIAPAWNQTTWFYASCAAAFLAATWGLYRLRLYQIAREFHAQLDGRVDERLRVARDLHDTMLQTFQAGLIQMQAGYNLLSRSPEKAAEAIQKAITTSAGAIAEGREAIHSMRSSTFTKNDLARSLRVAGDQMAAEGSATFEVRVQGSSRDVHPILRDEVYRIALEALRNAFKHAEANAIEAEIIYGESLRVRVRDDGKGFDAAMLKEGRRSGHYGLPGMRERADRIGGKLDVWSGAGAGTEIQLSIPGNIAFGKLGGGSLSARFHRKSKSDAAAQS